MTSLAEAIQVEITRVRGIQDTYKKLDGMPGVNVKPGIMFMEIAIQKGIKALAENDVMASLQVYEELKGFKQ